MTWRRSLLIIVISNGLLHDDDDGDDAEDDDNDDVDDDDHDDADDDAANDNNRDFKIQKRDGNENVAQKVNLRSFSLYRSYSYPLTLSNVGEPSWSWIRRHHIRVQ